MEDETMSPYERMEARRQQEQERTKASHERAVYDKYALLQVSPYRFAVIEVQSYLISGSDGLNDCVRWGMATKPVTWAEARQTLIELRRKQ